MTQRSMTPRRAEVVAVAGRLFAERGYRGASLRDIGTALGMRRGSLYAHFDSKEEILHLVVEPALAEVDALIDSALAGERDLASTVREAVLGCLRRRDALLILVQDRLLIEETPGLAGLSAEAVAVTQKWMDLAERSIAEGVVRPGLRPESVVFALYGHFMAVLLDRQVGVELTEVLPREADALADLVVDLFLSGVGRR